jgi:hypothetical protein
MKNHNDLIHSFDGPDNYNNKGLTKLEYFTALAMQGLITYGQVDPASIPTLAKHYAIEVLKELEK